MTIVGGIAWGLTPRMVVWWTRTKLTDYLLVGEEHVAKLMLMVLWEQVVAP